MARPAEWLWRSLTHLQEAAADVRAREGETGNGFVVSLLESLTPLLDSRRADPTIQSRRMLAEVLGLPRENRWKLLQGVMLSRLDD